ncbi:MAG: mechanosensitive ion channel family protein [Gemmatimonadales bacterium]
MIRPLLHAVVVGQVGTERTGTFINANFSVILVTVNRLLNGFLAMLPLLFAAILVFILLVFAAKGLRHVAEKALERSSNQSAATAISRLLYVAMVALAVLIAVTIAFPSMTPAKLVSVLGIGGVAIGFAFKDIFQNLLAGILILLRRPFAVGDEITTGEFTGTVEAIETRATIIRSYDGRRVIIPNGDVYTKPVIVISAYDMLRSEYDVGIGYGDDLTQAKTIALEAIKRIDGVLADPAPDVLVWELGDSAKNIRIRWWTKPARADVLRIRDGVLKEVAEAIANAGMDLPFPTQVVLFHDQTEETDGDRTRQREGWPAGNTPPKPRDSGNRN